jgi:hypothetical protein
MKKIIRLTESDLKLIIKRVINEDNVFGNIARKALSWAGKNEDDIANLFRTSEKVLAQSIDDIVGNAMKSKSISNLDDIQMKLMHYYNPSAIAENIPKAQQQMKNFLNGYSKSKGKSNWTQIRDEVTGTPQPKTASATGQAASQTVKDLFKGTRVSNNSFTKMKPDFSPGNITNAKNMDEYNEVIAQAIKTGDYSYISSKGFEKFGIPNFRNYLKNNIAKVNEVDPSTGRWSVDFK